MNEVIQYISTTIGSQEAQLLSRLEINESEEENTLSEVLKYIPWRKIRSHLERLGRSDIVEHITKSTLITEGIYFQIVSAVFYISTTKNFWIDLEVL